MIVAPAGVPPTSLIMPAPPSGVRVLVAIVQTVLRQDPFSGTIYVFRSNARTG